MAKFENQITADPSQFNAAMDQAARAAMSASQRIQSSWRDATSNMRDTVGQGVGSMSGAFGALVGAVGKVNVAMAAVGTVLAGGAAFKAGVDATVQMTREAQGLARALGITETKAGVLNVALGDVYISQETLIGANAKMTRQLVENEDAFKKLGIATRDASTGGYRPALDIMLETNKALLRFPEGIQRNVEGTKIYGKSWAEVSQVLKLNTDVMEEARKKSEQLGLAVGAENVAATIKYRAAMNDVGDVLNGVKKVIGDALLPILTRLGEWFSSIGPALVATFRYAIGALASAMWILLAVVRTLWEGVKVAFNNMSDIVMTFARAFMQVLKGDFSGAWDSLRTMPEKVAANWVESFGNLKDIAADTKDQIVALFADPTATTKRVTPNALQATGKEETKKTEKKEQSRVSQWEAELAAERDAYDQIALLAGSFAEFSKEQERDYWNAKRQLKDLSQEESLAVTKKYFGLERDLRKEAFEAEIAGDKARLEAFKAASAERIVAAGEIANKVGQKFGLESKQYAEALAEMAKLARERQSELVKIEERGIDQRAAVQSSALDLERQLVENSAALGFIKESEKLRFFREFKQRELQIESEALQAKAALYEQDSLQFQAAMDRLEQIKLKSKAEITKIDGQIAQESKRQMDTYFDPIATGFDKLVTGMIQGTRAWGLELANIGKAVLAEYTTLGVKLMVNWLKTELFKTSATEAGVATRVAAEEAGAGQSLLITVATAVKTIAIKAWEAAAAVYASIAAIPYIGPFLAPAMAVGAAATLFGYIGRISSAEGGYNIPSGVNPLTQLHQEEMVLPADIANPLRDMVAGGGQAGGATHITINAMDAQSLSRFLERNADAMVPAIKRAARLNTAGFAR
jgi:hypothetical protein